MNWYIGSINLHFRWSQYHLSFSRHQTVSQGMEYTVERFGKYTKTLKLGLHLIIPIIDRVGYKLNIREQIMDVSSQEVVTKDDAIVQVNGVVLFQII